MKYDNWFTIEKIDNDTFVISEYMHWEQTHCYLLLGSKKAVLIDTGLGVSNIRNVVRHITNLPIVVLTTHVHWDHIGGHKYFNEIAVHEKEVSWLSEEFPLPLRKIKEILTSGICDFPREFSIDSYQIFRGHVEKVLHDGDIVDIGNRVIKAIHTPGHSLGHCCFYEENRSYLYSGDLIYRGCLDAYYPTTDPYLFGSSVKKIRLLKVKRILPAHYDLNIPLSMISRIENAFDKLYKSGLLKHGSGIFSFEDFKIHI